MNRETLDRWCERGILALVLAILVFAPLATGAVGPLELLVVQALTLGVLALWLVRLWVSESPRLLWPPICWVVLLFVGYTLARYLTCDIEYAGRQELIRVLVYAFLFLAIVNNLYRQEFPQIVFFALFGVAVLVSFFALWQFLGGVDKVPSLGAWLESLIFPHKTWFYQRSYLDRGSGTYINPNHLAGFLEMLLPLALAYTLAGRARPLTKVLLGYTALVMVVGIGVTVSRGSWVAGGFAALTLFAVLATYRSYRLPALVLMCLLLVGSSFMVTRTEYFKERFRGAFVSGRLELDVRYELWEATMRMWRDHQWFGVGPGHFDYRFRAYRPVSVQLRPDRAHNEYLNTLADWGVAGTAIVVLAFGVLFIGVIKTWRYVRRSDQDFKSNFSNKFAFVLGAGFGLVALLIHSIVDFNMQIPANAMLAVSLMAWLSSHLRFATDRYWVRAQSWVRVPLSLILLAGLAYLGWQETRLAREYYWRERAAGQANYSNARIADLERAYAAEPMNFETTFAIGECYRVQSSEGGEEYEGRPGYRTLAQQAMQWYERGMVCNPYDGYNHLFYGWCVNWLRHAGEPDEAWPHYNRADELDPNGYFTAAHIGRYFIQLENFAAAKPWLQRSLRLKPKDNKIAESYLQIANHKMLEAVTPPTRTLMPSP